MTATNELVKIRSGNGSC